MGRVVTAEARLESTLKRFGVSSNENKTALLIGNNVSESRDHVLAILPTPELQRIGEGKGSDNWWVSEYARQVSGSLPGGVAVLGLAVVFPVSQLKGRHSQLKLLLQQVWRQCQWHAVESDKDWKQLLVHVCSETKGTRCLVADMQAGLNPVDIKFQRQPSAMIMVQSSFCLSQKILVGFDCADSRRVLEQGMREVLWAVSNSVVCTSSGRLPSPSDPLVQIAPKNGKALKVLFYYRESEGAQQQLSKTSSQSWVSLTGTITCIGFLQARVQWQDAVKALKEDAVRSLMVRQAMMHEEMDVKGESPRKQAATSSTSPCLVRFPRRVAVDVGTRFLLSDYCFQAEPDEDAVEHLCELWDVDIKTGDIKVVWAEETTLPPTDSLSESKGEEPSRQAKLVVTAAVGAIGNLAPFTVASVAAVIVVMLAVLLWRLLSY